MWEKYGVQGGSSASQSASQTISKASHSSLEGRIPLLFFNGLLVDEKFVGTALAVSDVFPPRWGHNGGDAAPSGGRKAARKCPAPPREPHQCVGRAVFGRRE